MQEIIFNRSPQTMKIYIDDKEFECKVRFSMLDLQNFYEQREAGKTGKEAVVESIFRNLIDAEGYDEQRLVDGIRNLTDDFFELYLQMIVEKDSVAKETYNECVGSCFDRYYAASQKSWAAQWKELKPVINTAALEMRKAVFSNMGKSLVNFSVSISNMIKPIIDMQEVINSYSKQINETISKTLGNLSQVIGSLVTKINIPTYTEEDRQRIKDSHVKWGEYGWSIIPEAPLKLYFTVPENRKEANRLALKYCGNSAMENLFSEMKDVAGVKKSDFEDAVFCFKNKKYKPCAMILFSLLDAKLIRMQKDDDRNKKNNLRPSGGKAAKNIEKRLAPEVANSFYYALSFVNLFACIETVFENGNDFVSQPDCINRNFLEHGMLTRKVKRMECVQLFLLYYNFLKMLEWMKR